MLPLRNPDDEIRKFARRFFQLAAEGDVAASCALLDEANCYGIVWTPKLIWDRVSDIFSSGTLFYRLHPEGPKFTDPALLAEPERFVVGVLSDRSGYWYNYDVPLNGEWSDLTAQFEFKIRPDGLAAILHDLHVM